MRRLYIGPEQRRRDKLTASYHRLKNAVPSQGLCRVSRPRPSKMALLECATDRINSLEKNRQQLIAKILEVEAEAARLRQCVHSELLCVDLMTQRSRANNEAINEAYEVFSLSVVGQNLTVAPTLP